MHPFVFSRFLCSSCLLFFLVALSQAQSQHPWELKKNVDGIQVYYRESADSPIKELKLNFTIDAPLNEILAILNDIDAYPEWVYSCTKAAVLQRANKHEMVYYEEIDFPWPMSNRDVVAHSRISRDPQTGIITTVSSARPDFKERESGVVRIEVLEHGWRMVPLPNETVEMEYYLKSDPGGMIPAWMVNWALAHGPIKTIQSMRQRLETGKYANVIVPILKD